MCIWNSDKAWLVSTSQCPKSQLGDLNGWDDSKSLKLESSGDDFTQPVWFLGWDDTNSWGSLDIYLSSVCLSICLSIYLIIFIYSWDFFTWTFHTASLLWQLRVARASVPPSKAEFACVLWHRLKSHSIASLYSLAWSSHKPAQILGEDTQTTNLSIKGVSKNLRLCLRMVRMYLTINGVLESIKYSLLNSTTPHDLHCYHPDPSHNQHPSASVIPLFPL